MTIRQILSIMIDILILQMNDRIMMMIWYTKYPPTTEKERKKIRDDGGSMDILSVCMQTLRLVDKTRSVSFTSYPSHIKFQLHVLFFSSLILKYQKQKKLLFSGKE